MLFICTLSLLPALTPFCLCKWTKLIKFWNATYSLTINNAVLNGSVKSAPRKLSPRKLPPRKLSPIKTAPYENCPIWKCPPLKIDPKKTTTRKLTLRKFSFMKVATIVVRNWKLLPRRPYVVIKNKVWWPGWWSWVLWKYGYLFNLTWIVVYH